jgi:hypothetical protein
MNPSHPIDPHRLDVGVNGYRNGINDHTCV